MTLDQIEQQMPADLLARAVGISAELEFAPRAEKTPEETGVFSFDIREWEERLEQEISALSFESPHQEEIVAGKTQTTIPYSSTGEMLPSVYSQILEKEFWQSTSTPLGRLASRAVISTTTGCWSIVKGRNEMGYVKVCGDYGLPKKEGRDYGTLSHKLAFVLRQGMMGLGMEVPYKMQLDHKCRNPACCNPNHVQPIPGTLNKQLMAKAHKVEDPLELGQIMECPTGLRWLDQYIANCRTEDTSIIISTRFGPYRIFKLDDGTIEGRREPCEVFDVLRPPKPNNYVPKSRAKKHKPIEGEDPLFLSPENEDKLEGMTEDEIKIATASYVEVGKKQTAAELYREEVQRT